MLGTQTLGAAAERLMPDLANFPHSGQAAAVLRRVESIRRQKGERPGLHFRPWQKVTAEVKLSAELTQKHLQTTPEAMADYWRMSSIGSVLNGLAALYLATG